MFAPIRSTRAQGHLLPGEANAGPWGFVCSQPLFYYGKDPFLALDRAAARTAFRRRKAQRRTATLP